ncbi:hypothetical protein [Mesorhizobium sp. J428]|uniref:hypothetical protein n=1 Tax=Mesorhizobium sp. J428 TaxID=2898440 RepID=UPI002151B338|nr:hypothetical protein [Mesorhizobium sp. J428]MCR5855526.1 hypothetical protein [Mesorhizobium sp. J428]
MFAVELGAALLIQLETDGGIVRILADAGDGRHDVNSRLPKAVSDFGGQAIHIDLMIGTHYDRDHLEGLIAIIENPAVSIGEAWLPPVANDTVLQMAGEPIPDRNLLALQFARPDGSQVLADYLDSKERVCLRLGGMERSVDRLREVKRRWSMDDDLPRPWRGREGFSAEAIEAVEGVFARHLSDAESTVESVTRARDTGRVLHGHGDDRMENPWELTERLQALGKRARGGKRRPIALDFDLEFQSWEAVPANASQLVTLAAIRKAAAKDAINAAWLNKVVTALRKKRVPIRCSTIPDGTPRRFGWDGSAKRFSPLAAGDKGPSIVLLGPSDSLVQKYAEKLPVGVYAMLFETRIPIKPITASNQLSYVMVVEHGQERILISGDAGCVDFRHGRNDPYFPDLLKELSTLNVVQVAHHAGYNSHFYRCLLDAGFPAQGSVTYLLLSHATNDEVRPTPEFSKFIENMALDRRNVSLLFTCQPQEAKVRDVKSVIAPVEGGASSSSGDVRLLFDGTSWTLRRHAVAVQ